MTVGPGVVVELVRGITSADEEERGAWAGAAGFELEDYQGIDGQESRIVGPAHIWAMCIESSVDNREHFLNSLDSFAQGDEVGPVAVSEIMAWLEVTGTSRAEVDYVETFQAILARTGATPEIPLTPERSAPLVDLLRGITSTLPAERRDATRLVPEVLPDLRVEEIGCFAGVLARAFVLDDDAGGRSAQLATLCVTVEHGALDPGGRAMVSDALAGDRTIEPDLRARWDTLTPATERGW